MYVQRHLCLPVHVEASRNPWVLFLSLHWPCFWTRKITQNLSIWLTSGPHVCKANNLLVKLFISSTTLEVFLEKIKILLVQSNRVSNPAKLRKIIIFLESSWYISQNATHFTAVLGGYGNEKRSWGQVKPNVHIIRTLSISCCAVCSRSPELYLFIFYILHMHEVMTITDVRILFSIV